MRHALLVHRTPKGVNTRAFGALDALLRVTFKLTAPMSVAFVPPSEIQRLNRTYRKKNRPTTVLAFPFTETSEEPDSFAAERVMGEIVLCMSSIRAQASLHDASITDAVVRYALHGALHILGHDHKTAQQEETMQKKEKALLKRLKIAWQ